jgi:hypothetical protein
MAPRSREARRMRLWDEARISEPMANDALSGCGPTKHQETRWILPAVRLNA